MKHDDRPFRVDTSKPDGTTRLYAAYRTSAEAEAAARQLRALGVELVTVRGPADLDEPRRGPFQ